MVKIGESMKVWVVLTGMNHMGTTIDNVFKTKKRAEQHAEVLRKQDFTSWDYVSVERWMVQS